MKATADMETLDATVIMKDVLVRNFKVHNYWRMEVSTEGVLTIWTTDMRTVPFVVIAPGVWLYVTVGRSEVSSES